MRLHSRCHSAHRLRHRPVPGGQVCSQVEAEHRSGSGRDNCGACHSLDYIQMNSPIQDKKGWTATVGKMVKVMGAPISEDDQKSIIAYLSSHYADSSSKPFDHALIGPFP